MLSEESLSQLSLLAQHEIKESEANVPRELAKLENFLADTYPNLRLPPDFQCFLLRSLRARKFDLKKAAKLVSNYFKLLHHLSDMHVYLVPATNDMLTGPIISVLKHRDSFGRPVVLVKYETIPPDRVDDLLGAFMLMNDFINQISIDTQRIGIVLMADFLGFGFAHLRALSLRLGRIRAVVKSLQDSQPFRLKGIHVVRNPAAASLLYELARPFLSHKLQQRIHFHGYNFKSLHHHVRSEILPQCLGGALPDNDFADTKINSQLIARSDYFRDALKYGYNTTT